MVLDSQSIRKNKQYGIRQTKIIQSCEDGENTTKHRFLEEPNF